MQGASVVQGSSFEGFTRHQNTNVQATAISRRQFSKQTKMCAMTTMKGMAMGEYGLHASSQKLVCEELYHKYTSRALEQLLEEGKTIVELADFGAADCINSVENYKQIIKQVENGNVVINIIDLPDNDWKMAEDCCATVGIPVVHKHSGKQDVMEIKGNVAGSRFELIGHTFYEQCLPTNSIDIAFSSIANHWLSSGEGLQLPGSILHSVHQERTSAEDREAMRRRSLEDGVKFLVSRGEELVSGGSLLMGNLSTIEKEDGTSEATMRVLVETMNDILVKWVEQGKISQEEINQLVLPCYFKSEAEWRKCFEDPRVKSSGLEIVEVKNVYLENPYYQRYYAGMEEDKKGDAANVFATEYVKSWLAIVKRIFMEVFKTDFELNAFIEEVKLAIASQPENCKVDYAITYIVAEKAVQ